METTRIEVPRVRPGRVEYGGLESFNVAVDHDARVVVYIWIENEDPSWQRLGIHEIDSDAVVSIANRKLEIMHPLYPHAYYAAWSDESGEVNVKHVAGSEDNRTEARAIAAKMLGSG